MNLYMEPNKQLIDAVTEEMQAYRQARDFSAQIRVHRRRNRMIHAAWLSLIALAVISIITVHLAIIAFVVLIPVLGYVTQKYYSFDIEELIEKRDQALRDAEYLFVNTERVVSDAL